MMKAGFRLVGGDLSLLGVGLSCVWVPLGRCCRDAESMKRGCCVRKGVVIVVVVPPGGGFVVPGVDDGCLGVPIEAGIVEVVVLAGMRSDVPGPCAVLCKPGDDGPCGGDGSGDDKIGSKRALPRCASGVSASAFASRSAEIRRRLDRSGADPNSRSNSASIAPVHPAGLLSMSASGMRRPVSVSWERPPSGSSITSRSRREADPAAFPPVDRADATGVENGDSSASISSCGLGVSCERRKRGVDANWGLRLAREGFGRGGKWKGEGVWSG
jgi:hypothetical protein